MTQELLDKIGEYYVNSGVDLIELADIFKLDMYSIVRFFTQREQVRLTDEIQEKVNKKKEAEDAKISNLLILALKFRLSLKNACKLSGIENPSEEDGLKMWDRITIYAKDKTLDLGPYKYLFNYETVNSPNKYEFSSLFEARYFLNRLKEETNPEEKARLISELTKEETDFSNFAKHYSPKKKVSLGDINIVERYRVKYGINQHAIADVLHVDKNIIQGWDTQIDDEKLLYRIRQLNSYQSALHELQRKR